MVKHKQDENMKKSRSNDQGFAHIEIIIIAVVVVGLIGFIGWRFFGSQNSSDNAALDKATEQALKAECDKIDDDDLCKFFTSWKTNAKYRMVSTQNGSKSTFEVDGDKSRISMTGETAYDVITIGKTTYTKAGATWYKQTIKEPEQDVAKDYKQDFSEPSDDESKPAEDKTTYKKLGKEACGNLQCFKYEIIDPSRGDSKEFIWFDDKDYQIRKQLSQSPEFTSETTYEYGNVNISVPSPVKELGPDQYIVPGQSEPATMPTYPNEPTYY